MFTISLAPPVVVQRVKFLFFIWGSLGSSINLETSYPKWHFSYFCNVSHGKCHVTQIRSRKLPTKSFPVHYSLRIPSAVHKVVWTSHKTGGNKLNLQCVFDITNEMQLVHCSLLLLALYTFRAVLPPIIRSLQNSMYSLGYCHAFLLSTAGVDGYSTLAQQAGMPPWPWSRQ